MPTYLSITDSDAHVDFPSVEEKRATFTKYFKFASVPCPRCAGWGGHNLQLNAHTLPKGMEDTAENRHKYVHPRAHCRQCNGWGFVKANSPDALCIHEMDAGRIIGNCLREYTCTLCGHKRTVDSSG